MKAPSQAARLGAAEKCPLCGAGSGVTEEGDGHRCLVCGAPRVLVDVTLERTYPERPYLERAKALEMRRAAWGVGASIATAITLVALAVTALLALFVDYGAVLRVVAAVSVLVPLLLAVLGFRQARHSAAAARAVMAEAERAVAHELVRVSGSSSAADLARWMRIPLERAEALSAEAQVEGFLSADTGTARLRVEEEPAASAQTNAQRKRAE